MFFILVVFCRSLVKSQPRHHTMYTRELLALVNQIRTALGALALLNWNGSLYSRDANVSDGDTYDYVVVGGGTAGSVVAARLVQANYSVLLIEAGDIPGIESSFPGLATYTKHSRIDWNFTTERNSFTGRCHKPGSGPSVGKALGGSGATNYMIYARGNPLDYEKIFKITKDPSWKWENMLKYFKMSEKLEDEAVLSSAYGMYHSSQGTIGVIKENSSVCDEYLRAFEEAGENVVVDNIGAGILGYSSGLYNIYNGLRTTSAESYLPPLKNNSKLFMTRNSLVTKIIFDRHKNAVGVSFVKGGNTITVNTNKEVIVTCGSIKSPQLLMLSGIGPKKELERFNITVLSDIPVGKNLQNAVGATLAFKTNRPAKPVEFNAHNFPTTLIVGYSALNKSHKYPDYESLNYIIDDYQFLLKFCAFTLEYNNSICDRLYTLANNSQVLFSNVIGLNQKSRGQILLRSTNPEDQPRIITGYYSYDEDLKATVNNILDFIKIESTPFGQCNGLEFLEVTTRCSHLEFNSQEYWRCYALCMTVTTWRDCGTCSLGSVVDTKLSVLGVNRLRVADASVFPNSLGGAIFAPEVALAEKAAEMIIEHADTYNN